MATIIDIDDFSAETDCECLHAAMKGLGTDEDTITAIICRRSNDQRQELKTQFAQMFGKDLVEALKDELSSHYEDVIVGLFYTRPEYDAHELHKAIKGLGTDEAVLIEILASRTNDEIAAIKEVYKEKYDNDLVEDIDNDTSGDFGRLMYSLAQGARQEDDEVCHVKAYEDANALIEAGEAQWGTDESRFNVILASRSFDQLAVTCEKYEELSEKTMEEAIESEMSGDLKKGMLAIVKCAKSRQKYFAERLYKSMKGLGTDDNTLVRLMVSRCEIDMMIIKEYFEAAYEQTLEAFIEDDCSGDYKKALLCLAIGNY